MLQNLMGESDKYYNGSEILRDKQVQREREKNIWAISCSICSNAPKE